MRGLEQRSDFTFLTYPYKSLPCLNDYILLTLDAPELTIQDASLGLLIVDATWRYAAKMVQSLKSQSKENQINFHYRSLPAHYRTAYPRRQNDCPDPTKGLASVEAIYLSYLIFQRDTTGLLDNYYWKNQFLDVNQIV